MSAVSTRTRFEIFKRDEFTCAYCGQTPPAVILHVDHIVPVSKGGDASLLNLITACSKCNMGKSNIPLDVVPASIEEMHVDARERHEQLIEYNQWLREAKVKRDEWALQLKDHWAALGGHDPASCAWPDKGGSSVSYFLEKLPYEILVKFMDKAAVKFPDELEEMSRFKYFCGCCHHRINGTYKWAE